MGEGFFRLTAFNDLENTKKAVERLKKVLEGIKTRGDIVLFIDEIHTIVGAGSADGALVPPTC